MTDRTYSVQKQAFDRFVTFAAPRNVMLLAADDVDSLLTDYAKSLFDRDQPMSWIINSILFLQSARPNLRFHLPRVWRTVTTWQKRTPPKSRVPLPPQIFWSMVSLTALWGWPEVTLALAFMFCGLLRPSEATNLLFEDALFDSEAGLPPSSTLIVIRNPKNSSSYGHRQFVKLVESWICDLLRQFKNAHPRKAGALFDLSYSALSWRFTCLKNHLFLASSKLTLSSCRTGGTTYLNLFLSPDLLRVRGRWKSLITLEIYLQLHGSIMLWAKLAPTAQARIMLFVQVVAEALHTLYPPPRKAG